MRCHIAVAMSYTGAAMAVSWESAMYAGLLLVNRTDLYLLGGLRPASAVFQED